MSDLRPVLVGGYELLHDFTTRDASVRVLRLSEAAAIEPHLHRQSRQIYVALEGASVIDIGGIETQLSPFAALEVAPELLHSARAATGPSILMNISIPPLQASDQIPVWAAQPYREDFRLPGPTADVEE